jgi:phosphoglycolate phosphatase-like HAD superfamily hydrolase
LYRRIEDIEYLKYDKLVPHALAILGSLQKASDLVLLTLRHDRKNLLWQLKSLELLDYFKEVLSGSTSSNDKSLLAQEYFNKISSCTKLVMIGDSEVDLTAGKQFKMLTIAVTYGIRSKEFLSKLEPTFCLERLSQVLDILK